MLAYKFEYKCLNPAHLLIKKRLLISEVSLLQLKTLPDKINRQIDPDILIYLNFVEASCTIGVVFIPDFSMCHA